MDFIDNDDTGSVSRNVNQAGAVYEKLELNENFLYVPVELLDELEESKENEGEISIVYNTPENLEKLGLKDKGGVLVRVQQYYVLSLIENEAEHKQLWFASEDVSNGCLSVSNNLKNAWLSEVCFDDKRELIYIEKEKIDRLAYSNIEKATHVDNSRYNRMTLGLKYKDEVLQRATGAGIEEDYILSMEEDHAKETHLALPFWSKEDDSITNDLNEASTQEAPFSLNNSLYVKKKTIESLLTPFPDGSMVLLNCTSNLEALGLEYQDGILSQVEVEDTRKEAPPKEEEKAPEEAPKVSWLKIGLSAFSLAMDLKKAYELSKATPQPKSRTTNINILAANIHLVNKEKGFWDEKRNVGEMLMLVTSELGEAMEAHRKGKYSDWIGYQEAMEGTAPMTEQEAFEHCIKDSFEDEIADAVIRLLDLAAGLNINLEKQMEAKLAYNRTRERFHGKEY
jgi:NTP pyrophosphatase (non-canonical NTP hydrolase)